MPSCESICPVGGVLSPYVVAAVTLTECEWGLAAVYREIVAPERLVATEKFDQAVGKSR